MDKIELEKLYRTKTNIELFEINLNSSDYTIEANNALQTIITERGGIDNLSKEYELLLSSNEEIEIISNQINTELEKGKSKSEILNAISSKIFEKSQIEEISSNCFNEFEEVQRNKKITPLSLVGGIIGAIVGAIIGGILWGLMMAWSNRIIFIFGIGLILLCYFFVWLFSRKNKLNIATIILTSISVFLALYIGQIIFEISLTSDYFN